jgi:hypothetical protein
MAFGHFPLFCGGHKNNHTLRCGYFYGGLEGIRTLDLSDANRTLSQDGKFSAQGLRCMVCENGYRLLSLVLNPWNAAASVRNKAVNPIVGQFGLRKRHFFNRSFDAAIC